jgi:hypothetical protein
MRRSVWLKFMVMRNAMLVRVTSRQQACVNGIGNGGVDGLYIAAKNALMRKRTKVW